MAVFNGTPGLTLHAAEIHEAAALGDLNKVRTLLDADPALLESKDKDGYTPLISACFAPPSFNPQVAVANDLIARGADVKARNNWDGTPLYCALRSPDLIQRLIDRGADVNARAFGANGLTPLQQAAAIGELATAKLLIDHGADLNGRSSDGTVLQNLIKRNGDPARDMVRLLLEGGAKLQEFSFGNTELHLAALHGAADVARLLVEHGADVNAANEYGHTALFYAARHGRRRVADALTALGANPKEIVEENYGRAPQLTATLQDGEAHLWFLGGLSPGTGYAVKTKGHLLIFDPYLIDDSAEAGLANGRLNPQELAEQKITFFATRSIHDGPSAPDLAKKFPGGNFVLGFTPTAATGETIPKFRFASPREAFAIGDIQVRTVAATGRHYIEGVRGVGYLVEVDGLKIFHAGLHAASSDAAEQVAYRREVDYLKEFGPVDIAILPIHGRHISIAYEPYLHLIDQLSPKTIYLIGDDLATEEHRKALEVLRARNVPVFYPEGGIAVGERFHFVREQTSHTWSPKTEVRPLSGDYLGQPPPGVVPVVFAPGIVSTDGTNEHMAPSFSPDGNEMLWFSNRWPDEGPSLSMITRRENGRWSAPRATPFPAVMPVFAPDGRRVHFHAFTPGPALSDKGQSHLDIWMVEKQGDGWSEPQCLNLAVRYPEVRFAAMPRLTRNGTLYFLGYAPGLRNDSGIYRAELVHGEYAKPELLPRSINLPPFLNWAPFIAPDESYLLFSSNRTGSLDEYGDIYLSRRHADGSWTEPVSLGEQVNTPQQEVFPGLSPDGKYLFFCRYTPGRKNDVYWVSTAAVSALHPTTRTSTE